MIDIDREKEKAIEKSKREAVIIDRLFDNFDIKEEEEKIKIILKLEAKLNTILFKLFQYCQPKSRLFRFQKMQQNMSKMIELLEDFEKRNM